MITGYINAIKDVGSHDFLKISTLNKKPSIFSIVSVLKSFQNVKVNVIQSNTKENQGIKRGISFCNILVYANF